MRKKCKQWGIRRGVSLQVGMVGSGEGGQALLLELGHSGGTSLPSQNALVMVFHNCSGFEAGALLFSFKENIIECLGGSVG